MNGTRRTVVLADRFTFREDRKLVARAIREKRRLAEQEETIRVEGTE